MTEFDSHPPGTPNWIDLMSPDVDASKAFYAAVFGWDMSDEFDDDGNRIYTMCRVDGKNVAGIGGQPPGMPEGMPPVWNSYVSVADAEATTGAAVGAGGSVMMPPMQVMEAGTMAILSDPTGAAFSIWQPGQHIGIELGNEPNTLTWNELMTRDLDSAKEFYGKVFGWTYDVMEMPTGPYNVIEGGENGGLGALMGMPPDVPEQVPNHWGVYFAVASVDDSIAKVETAGGQVVMPPMDIPGVGRMTVVHDTAGGAFSLMQPEAA
jgi:predicted enzyme related to lactoylglutathione lyase